MNQKTHEEFVQQIKELVGNQYSVLTKYTKYNKKIKMRHNKCKCEFEVTPNNFLNGQRCPKCSLKERIRKHSNFKANEQFIEEVKLVRGDIYIFHSKYINAKTKVDIECKICGKRYMADPRQLLKKTETAGCKYCIQSLRNAGNKWHRPPKYTTESFGKIVSDITNGEYKLIGKYENVKKKTKIKHIKCGTIYEVTPDHFINTKTRCPVCYGHPRKTTDEFKKEVCELVGDEYSAIGEYKTARKKIKMKHNVCNYIYEVTPDAFLRGNRCPKCFKSKGELKIAEYLKDNGAQFRSEYTFNDLLSDLNNPLRFDFAIFKNDSLVQLIEYDGEFHYNKKYPNYKILKIHDEKKNKYCKINKIPLLRIPYWEFDNVNEILSKNLFKEGGCLL